MGKHAEWVRLSGGLSGGSGHRSAATTVQGAQRQANGEQPKGHGDGVPGVESGAGQGVPTGRAGAAIGPRVIDIGGIGGIQRLRNLR
jgi:hypothetical protein